MRHLAEEAAGVQVRVDRDVERGLHGQAEVAVALGPLDQGVALLGGAELGGELLHLRAVRDAVRLLGPRLREQRFVARDLGVPLGEGVPAGVGGGLHVGDPAVVAGAVGDAGRVDEDDLAVLELALLERAEARTDDRVAQPARAGPLRDHPVPHVEVGVRRLDDRRDHGLLERDFAADRAAAAQPLEDRGDRGGDGEVGGLLVGELAGRVVGRQIGEAVADQLAARGHRDQVGRIGSGPPAAEDDVDDARRALRARFRRGAEPGEHGGGMRVLGHRRDDGVGRGGQALDLRPGLRGVEVERERFLALVEEQVPQGAFAAGLAAEPWAGAARAVAGGVLDPDHARAEVGEVAPGDDQRLVGEVEDERPLQRPHQNSAIGLIGEAVPPLSRSGAMVSRNSQRCRSAQARPSGPRRALSIRCTPM